MPALGESTAEPPTLVPRKQMVASRAMQAPRARQQGRGVAAAGRAVWFLLRCWLPVFLENVDDDILPGAKQQPLGVAAVNLRRSAMQQPE